MLLTIRARLLATILLAFCLGITALIGTIYSITGSAFDRSTERYGTEVAARYSGEIKAELDSAMTIAETLASSLGGLKKNGVTSRDNFNYILKTTLENAPFLLGAWSAWGPNKLEGNDIKFASYDAGHDKSGRFIPYWYRADGKIVVEPLASYDTPGDGDFFLLAYNSGKPQLLEPYIYPVGGVDKLITSLVVPIIVNGEVLGVAGVDITMEAAQALVVDSKPLGGQVSIASKDGLWVAYPNAETLGKPMTETNSAYDGLMNSISAGEPGRAKLVDPVLGKEVEVFSFPLLVKGTSTPWAAISMLPSDEIQADSKTILNTNIIGGVILALVIAAILWLVVSILLSKPLTKVSDAVTGIAEGRLENEIFGADRNDEVGVIAKATEVLRQGVIEKIAMEREAEIRKEKRAEEKQQAMMELATSLENSVGVVVTSVSESATNLQSTAKHMSGISENTRKLAVSCEQATQSASENVNAVASASEEMSASVGEISSQVSESAKIATQAAEDVAGANSQIQNLAAAVERISDVLSLINDIADQTNLLALNATIEAARAGDAGKGFAVVASEVKNLANQTAKATEDIRSQITDVQTATEDSVKAIHEIGQVIGRVNEISSAISAAVEEQGAATSEISRGAQMAADGTQNATSSISGVADAVNEAEAASEEVLNAANQLSQQGGELRSEVQTFLEKIRSA